MLTNAAQSWALSGSRMGIKVGRSDVVTPVERRGLLFGLFLVVKMGGPGVQNRSQSLTGVLKGYLKVRRLQFSHVVENNPKVTFE